MKKIDFRKNASGLPDPTFYQAMLAADAESDRVRDLVKHIKHICKAEGFSIENRVILKSNETGKLYK